MPQAYLSQNLQYWLIMRSSTLRHLINYCDYYFTNAHHVKDRNWKHIWNIRWWIKSISILGKLPSKSKLLTTTLVYGVLVNPLKPQLSYTVMTKRWNVNLRYWWSSWLQSPTYIGVQLINTPGSIGEREGEWEGYYFKDTHTEHKVWTIRLRLGCEIN